MLAHFYEDVAGWFSFKDVYRDALAEAQDGARIVEVGSWHGRSAAWMAVEIANSGKRIDFYCVDTWKGSVDSPWMAEGLVPIGGSCKPLFDAAMAKGGVSHLITAVEKPSVEAAAMFEDESLDFVMIDAAHDYDNVKADVRAWLPKVKLGGVIAGDDLDWPGVLIGVEEVIPLSQTTWRGEHAQKPGKPIHWWHRKAAYGPGEWLQMDFSENGLLRPGSPVLGGDVLIYVPYVNNEALLERALRSIEPYWSNVVVIDQSLGGLSESWHKRQLCGIYRVPHRKITFSQMQNWVRDLAIAKGLETLVFMHADAACRDHGVMPDLLQAGWPASAGITFTAYDALAAFRVKMLRDVGPWDETFSWYWGDTDYYRRCELAGWTQQTACENRVVHEPSQTMHSDPDVKAGVESTLPWAGAHYGHKWGAIPKAGPYYGTTVEKFRKPYNGSL